VQCDKTAVSKVSLFRLEEDAGQVEPGSYCKTEGNNCIYILLYMPVLIIQHYKLGSLIATSLPLFGMLSSW